ncbi:MAG: ribonuclease J [Alphaproteobacteria bacterium]|nr:ribonuclease J [Alphaproteobacteria bacterium]
MIEGFTRKGLYFIALGGAEEVGYNMFAYIVDGKIIVVDAGYGFLKDDFPGMEMGLADVSFLETYRDDIEAMFITHGHEDHYGAIGHIWDRFDCPLYAADFTLGHIKNRLKEYHINDFSRLHSINDNPQIKLNNFTVEFVPLVHSCPQSCGLLIHTVYGTVLHATDWRFDDDKTAISHTDYTKLKSAAAEGIDIYVGDSTNMSSDYNEPSEYEIRQSLLELVPSLSNTVVATCFASNIVRLESLILAASAAGRTPIISGHSLNQNYQIAKNCGYLQDTPPAFDIAKAQDIPSDKALYICAGSQGDYRSALSRIANGESKDIILSKGDNIIFSSKIIPGNEEKIERMQEKLRDMGVNVISSEDYQVHASGHATPSQIIEMYQMLKPKVVIPVHGDKRNIRKQRKLAKENGVGEVLVVRNGDVVLYHDGNAEIISEIFTRKLGVDRNKLVPLDAQLIKNRRRIAYNCSVFISVVFDQQWHLKDLQISSIDILEEADFTSLRDEIIEEIKKDISKELVKLNFKENAVKEYLAARIRRRIFKQTDIKPVVFMHFYHENNA